MLGSNVNIKDQVIIQGEGSIQVHTAFDCIMVKPHEGQVVRGTIIEQTPDGLTVEILSGVTFYVQSKNLMQPQLWDGSEKKWLWRTKKNAGLYYETGKVVKSRLLNVKDDFIDATCDEEGLGMVDWGNWNTY